MWYTVVYRRVWCGRIVYRTKRTQDLTKTLVWLQYRHFEFVSSHAETNN